jgi:hypothetical protein
MALGLDLTGAVAVTIGGYEIIFKVVTVTPDMATRWLTERNPSAAETSDGNRRIGGVAKTYAEAMTSGSWHVSPQNVFAFDETGRLIDGQHRLKAITISRTPIEFLVQVGWPRESFAFIDIGMIRQAKQFAPGPYANDRIAAAHILAALNGAAPYRDLISALSKDIAEELEWCGDWAEMDDLVIPIARCYKATKINRSLHLAMLCMASRTQHAHMIESWLDGLTSGAGLTKTDPRLHLRERWNQAKTLGRATAAPASRVTAYLTIVKTWNAYATRDPMSGLKIVSSDSSGGVIAVTGYRRLRST